MDTKTYDEKIKQLAVEGFARGISQSFREYVMEVHNSLFKRKIAISYLNCSACLIGVCQDIYRKRKTQENINEENNTKDGKKTKKS